MRILFITANRLGDAVLSTGLLGYLTETYPNAAITVASGPIPAPLFSALPGLDRNIVMEKQKFAGHWISLWRQTSGQRWDMVIDLRRSALSYLLRTRQRHSLPSPDETCHRVRFVARTLGLEDNPPAPCLWPSEAERSEAEKIIPDRPPVLAVAPAANWRGKQWRANNFAALVTRLTHSEGLLPNARVAVIAAADERDQAAPVLAAVPEERRIDLVGTRSLGTLGACLGRCALFIGNDSGLMHMAAAAGTATLGLFGPSRETLYAPWGESTGWVRTPESFEELTGAPDYDHRTTDTLMDGLTVDTVESALTELWHRVQKDAA
ncbi:MAG: glycosyl transferase [Rhodospirillaceae bacterium]|nr:glycosyl transferase [Rhodospirillaceae bacterium]